VNTAATAPATSRAAVRWPGLRRVADRVLRPLLRLSPTEALFVARGFPPAAPAARARLEAVGQTFIDGYNAALECSELDTLAHRLERVELPDRGFAYEGAAMALALRDALTPSPWGEARLPRFVTGQGAPHVYMLLVGAGWALARLRRRLDLALRRADPLLGWLMGDGYGFHEGYFDWRRHLVDRRVPRRLAGYALRTFDQGLGRSAWFVHGGSVPQITAAIGVFAESRRADLWSGVGLAAAYAGGVSDGHLRALRDAAGPFLPVLAQGAAFAAKARERAGNPVAHTNDACAVLCGCTAAEAAAATDAALSATPPDHDPESDPSLPRYERWRQAVVRELGFRAPET
jgi:enediyne biosynthesis protein E3